MKTKTTQKNIPDGWKSFKVKDVLEFVPTCSHSKEQMDYVEKDVNSVFNIHYGDIHTKYFKYVDLSKDQIPVLKEENGDISSRYILKEGDLVVVDASEDYEGVGSAVEIKNVGSKKCIAGLHTYALRGNKNVIALGYRTFLFKHPLVYKRLKQVSTYSKVYGFSKDSLSKVDLILPTLPEQNRIVSVLETWDVAIEKLTRKIEIKKNIKKGLMQNLLTGKVRLAGFTEKWKTVRLGETGVVQMGQSPSSSAYNEKSEGLPLIQGNNDIKDKKTIKRVWTTEITKTADEGDIIMTVRAPVGWIGIATEKVCIGRGVCVIKPNKADKDFIFHYLSFFEYRWKMFEQGSTFSAINSSDIKDLELKIPKTKEEQTAIANILTTADKEITELQKKLALLKDQKKYLLNNLIAGSIRTPETL